MSLYQDHRPNRFEDIVGNEAEVKSLQKILEKENRPHVFLFSGPSGCGKTTAARICAKVLEASDLAIHEVNSSNNRGIDTARQIIDQMRYYPNEGKSVVFILDEAHNFSRDMANAMLKSLEDTPKHCYFFLCTTNPEKLLTALKNRCTEIKFKPLSTQELAFLIKRTLREEGETLDKEMVLDVAEASEGSPRKALVLLEKVLSSDSDENRREIIKGGASEDDKETIDFCRILLQGRSWSEIAQTIKGLNVDDPEKIRYAVLGYMNAVLLSGKQNPKAAQVLEFFSENFYDSGKYGITLAAYQSFFT